MNATLGKPRRGLVLTLALLGATALALFVPAAPAEAIKPPSLPGHAPDNNDRSYFHLLWRGRQKQGNADWNWDNAQGGTKAILERFSGYCKDTWEVYGKMKIETAGLSSSADLEWETEARAETQYIREVYDRYLNSGPMTCNELRYGLSVMGVAPNAKIGTKWDAAKAQRYLDNVVCQRTNPQGVPWSFVVADQRDRTGARRRALESYCNLRRTDPAGSQRTYVVSDQLTELCTGPALVNPALKRHRIAVFSLPDPIDDIRAAIGRPTDDLPFNHKWKYGRMVLAETVVNGYPYRNHLSQNSTWRTFTCNAAGRWIQEPLGGLNVLSEMDKTARDFFDLQAGGPYGRDVIGSQYADLAAGRVNLWELFVFGTGSCRDGVLRYNFPGGGFDYFPQGKMCEPGSGGHTSIAALIGRIISG